MENREKNAHRREAIRTLHRQGWSSERLAAAFRISRQRVHGITSKAENPENAGGEISRPRANGSPLPADEYPLHPDHDDSATVHANRIDAGREGSTQAPRSTPATPHPSQDSAAEAVIAQNRAAILAAIGWR